MQKKLDNMNYLSTTTLSNSGIFVSLRSSRQWSATECHLCSVKFHNLKGMAGFFPPGLPLHIQAEDDTHRFLAPTKPASLKNSEILIAGFFVGSIERFKHRFASIKEIKLILLLRVRFDSY